MTIKTRRKQKTVNAKQSESALVVLSNSREDTCEIRQPMSDLSDTRPSPATGQQDVSRPQNWKKRRTDFLPKSEELCVP